MRGGATLAVAVCALSLGTAAFSDAPPRRVWVQDAAGAPLTDAQLLPVMPAAQGAPRHVDESAMPLAYADDRGWVTVPPGAAGELAILAKGHAPAVWTPPTADEPAAPVRLRPARTIHGRVRLADGARSPLPVFAVPTRSDGPAHRTVTSDDGAYVFPSLHEGMWMIAVQRPDGRLVSLGTVVAGTSAGTSALRADAQLQGTLYDLDRAAGAASCPVRLDPLEGTPGEPLRTTTDDKGRFAFASLAPGTWQVVLPDPAWAFDGPAPRVVVRTGTRPADVDGFVRRCPAVVGLVQNVDDQPVAGATVSLIADVARTWVAQEPLQATTARDGTFRVPSVPPGTYQALIVATGFSPWIGIPMTVPPVVDTRLHTVRLDPGWLLEATVSDLAGKPIAGAKIHVAPASRPHVATHSPWAPLARHVTTHADGKAAIPDLPLEDVFLTVRAPNRRVHHTHVAYPRTADRGHVEVSLGPAAALQGTVQPATAGGGPYALVVASRDGRDQHRVAVGPAPSHRYLVPGLRAVAYDVEVRRDADGLLLTRMEHVIPDGVTELPIPLPPRQVVEGRVYGLDDAGGAAQAQLESATYHRDLERYVWSVEQTAVVKATGKEGRFRFDGVRPGAYRLRVVQGGRATGGVQALVEDAPLDGITLRMEDGARLAGLVFGQDSRPRQAVYVTAEQLRGDGAMREPLSAARTTYTDDDGAFVFDALAPGLWRVTAATAGLAPRAVTLRLAPGETVVLEDVELVPGYRIRGAVATMQGVRLQGLRVVARTLDGSGPSRPAFTNAQGEYEIPDLAPGMYLVRVRGVDARFLPADHAAAEITDADVVVDFLPSEGAQIDVSVTRAAKPVPGAWVQLVSVPDLDSGVVARRRRQTTDDDGRASFTSLEAGTYHLVLEVGALRTEQTLIVQAHDRLDVPLEAHEGRLRGRVLGPTHQPVPGAYVEACHAVQKDLVVRTRTDGEGKFVLNGIPIAAYHVLVTAAGLPPGRLDATAELPGSDYPYDVSLGRGGNVRVTVVDRADRPIGDAQVFLEDIDGSSLHPWPSATDPEGVAWVPGLPPGPVHLRVRAVGYGASLPVRVDVADGATTEHRTVLGPAGVLRVAVFGTGADPVPRVQVEILVPGTRVVAAFRRPIRRLSPQEAGVVMPRAGAARFEDMAPGAYVVRVHAGARYQPVERTVQVVAGHVVPVDVDLTER